MVNFLFGFWYGFCVSILLGCLYLKIWIKKEQKMLRKLVLESKTRSKKLTKLVKELEIERGNKTKH